jgi:flagellar basal-body rod modification protein FlgD
MTTAAASTPSTAIRRLADSQAQQAASARTQSAVSTTGNAASDSRQLNANFDMFLQLLTTQLKNQSPLDPMKTEQFSQQVTQYSAVEQQIKTNSMLERLIGAQTAGSNTAALGFLGNEIAARGSTAELKGGEARWTLNAPQAASTQISVRNAAGAVVYAETRALGAGSQEFRWSGRDSNGVAQADGNYTIEVQAVGANQQPVSVTTSARGRVTAVDFSGSEPVLTVGGARVKLSEVTNVTLAR